jgi:hypothetical protein
VYGGAGKNDDIAVFGPGSRGDGVAIGQGGVGNESVFLYLVLTAAVNRAEGGIGDDFI